MIKTVVNDGGGSAVSSNWTMNVAGPTPLSFAGAAAPGTSSQVLAGSYKVTESAGPSGYALTYSGDCDADGDVVVPAGGSRDLRPHQQRPGRLADRGQARGQRQRWLGGVLELDDERRRSDPASFAGAESPGTSNSVDAGAY